MKLRILLSPQIEADTHEISGMVMSPFCPGRSLNDCPSSSATDLRNEISSMLQDGKNKDQVFQELYSRYGEGIRSMPKTEGFGLIGWLSPFLFVFIGLSVLFLWLKKHKPQTATPIKPAELSSEMKKRIEEEVYGKN